MSIIISFTSSALGAAKGLAYLESQKIIHRDVALRLTLRRFYLHVRNMQVAKIDGKYITKVSDFGLARRTETGAYSMSDSKLPIKWTSPEGM